MKERKKYIDIARGILILLVVVHHIDLLFIGWNPIPCDNVYFKLINHYSFISTTFFMPAFFIISGMCSNFKKGVRKGIMDDAKSLFIPALLCDIIFDFIGGNFGLWHHLSHFFLFGSGGWFFAALFVDKTLLRTAVKYIRKEWIVLFSLLTPFIAYYTFRSNDDIWSYTQAIDMLPFLVIGYYFRDINLDYKRTILFIITYIALLLFAANYNNHIPSVTHSYNIQSLIDAVYHVPLSISGSFGLIGLCRMIKNQAVLEYFGRISIVVYLFHFWFLRMLLPRFIDIACCNYNIYFSCVIYIGIFGLTILFCIIVNEILNTKYLRWSLGKYC